MLFSIRSGMLWPGLHRFRAPLVFGLIAGLCLFGVRASSAQPASQPQFSLIGTFQTQIFDEGAAEITTYDPASERLFFVNADANAVVVLDLSDPTSPTEQLTIDLSPFGEGANSVAVADGIVAVAVEADPAQDPGVIAFFDTDGMALGTVGAGPLPDAVVFTPDGTKVLVANEGEPNDEYSRDPEGSVSIIDISAGVGSASVETVGFASLNGQKQALIDQGVRIFGGVSTIDVTGFADSDPAELTLSSVEAAWDGLWLTLESDGDPIPYQIAGVDEATNTLVLTTDFDGDTELNSNLGPAHIQTGSATVAEDLEPENIAVSPDGSTAWVTLQENNAVAIVDVATASLVGVQPLGMKTHNQPGHGLDGSDEDGIINIRPWPVHGMYQPDAIAAYADGGATYYVTANEGDAREYDALIEEISIEDLQLDPVAFSDAATLQDDGDLGIGDLDTTPAFGDTDGDGDVDQIMTYGARSFSVWADDGTLLSDSGDDFERITATQLPANFNANNDENDFDGRSDDKGPEPEAVATGMIGGTPFAFIGLERIGGVMVYDLTDPTDPEFVVYFNNRDFSIDDVEASVTGDGAVGDLGPESIVFIPATESPNGQHLLVVSNEVSGSVSVYEARDAATACMLTTLGQTVDDGPPGVVTVTFDNPDGIERVDFTLLDNFTVANPDEAFTSNEEGTAWTPIAAPGPTAATFTLTQQQVDAASAYFAEVRSTCTDPDPLVTIFDPPFDFGGVERTFALQGNEPNPFKSRTAIQFTLPETADVSLAVYDILGRRVATLADGSHAAGSYTAYWDGRSAAGEPLASGVYFYRLEAGSSVHVRRMTLVR